jgi:glutamine amidotransferase-like uncharacterized protein
MQILLESAKNTMDNAVSIRDVRLVFNGICEGSLDDGQGGGFSLVEEEGFRDCSYPVPDIHDKHFLSLNGGMVLIASNEIGRWLDFDGHRGCDS